MNDYISRDDVLRKFIEGDGHDDDRFTEGYNFAVQEYREKVKKIPAADVQPINRWISVKDRLPEEAVKVLIYTEYNATAYGFFTGAYYNNRPLFAITMNRNSEHSWYEEIRVSHWMPLPKPPKDSDING